MDPGGAPDAGAALDASTTPAIAALSDADAVLADRMAAESVYSAQMMVQIAADAAARAVTRARQTAEAAVSAASEAAAEVIAEAHAVAEAKAIASSAATRATERMRQSFAGVIDAEVAANVGLAQIARALAEELAARKETEARLLEREAELTAFAAMVAHDLKAPLRAVAGYTSLLRSDLVTAAPAGLDGSVLDSMDRIVAATERMRGVVDSQLAFATARDHALKLEPVDLEAMITDIIIEYSTTWRGSARSRPAIGFGPLPMVEADPVMCRQLLDNLIANAVKYTAPGQSARVQVNARVEPGGMVEVDVADQGIGIQPGEHEKLFAAFYRVNAEYPGTGLGLAICQRIVNRHGGTIGVIDNPSGGSLFHFTLPVASRSLLPAVS